MKKYIDADKLRNRIKSEYTNCTQEFVKGFSEAFRLWNEELERMMKEESTVQEVRRGKWEICSDEYEICASEFVCSVCKESFFSSELTDEQFFEMMRYCPHCGAKMDGDKYDTK